MSTTIQINMPYRILLNHLNVIAGKGLNPEIYLNSDTLESYALKDIRKIAKTLHNHNLSVTIHGPFMDLSPGGVDSMVRKATVKRFSQALDAASHFHPGALVLHGGYNRWYFNGNRKLWLERSLLTWEPILKKASKLKIPIAIENVFEEEPDTLRDLMEGLDDPFFGICFDAGHFHLFSRVSMKEWFDTLGKYFIELHLHDNNKSNDDHLPMGEGTINFDEFFHLLQQYSIKPIYTIEPHRIEDVERSLEACCRYLGISGQKTVSFPPGISESLL